MSNRCSLETQTKKVSMVIDEPFNNSIQFIVDDLKKFGYLFAMIRHDKDVNNDGVLKNPHYHLVLNSPKRHRLKYFLTNICDIFDKVDFKGNPTINSVEIQVSESLEWDIQYLIHKNDKEKYQYNVDDIITNIPAQNLESMLSVEVHKDISVDDVVNVVMNCRSEIQVASKLGIGAYNLYHNIVVMCIRDGLLGTNLKDSD